MNSASTAAKKRGAANVYLPSVRSMTRAYAVTRSIADEIKKYAVVDDADHVTRWTTRRAEATRIPTKSRALAICVALHTGSGARPNTNSPYRAERVESANGAACVADEFAASGRALYGRQP